MNLTYYTKPGLSNSTLSKLKADLSTKDAFASENAFKQGTLVDAFITEPRTIDHIKLTIGDNQYTEEEFKWARKMKHAFFADPLCNHIHSQSIFQYECFRKVNFGIGEWLCKCKFDGWLNTYGWDLKTTGTSDVDQAIDMFDIDRQVYFYSTLMDCNKFMLIFLHKTSFKVSKRYVVKGDRTWNIGKIKTEELLNKYYLIYGDDTIAKAEH